MIADSVDRHRVITKNKFNTLLSIAGVVAVTPVCARMTTTSMAYLVAQKNTKKSLFALSKFTELLNSAGKANPQSLACVQNSHLTAFTRMCF